MAKTPFSRYCAVLLGINHRFQRVINRRVRLCDRAGTFGKLASGALTASLEALVHSADIAGDLAAFDRATRNE